MFHLNGNKSQEYISINDLATGQLIIDDEPYGLFDAGQIWIDPENPSVEIRSQADAAAEALRLAKGEAVTKIHARAHQIRLSIAKTADPIQLAGWPNKASRARRVLADPANADPADIAILQAECSKRGKGESPTDLAQLQLKKEAGFATACSVIDGLTDAAEAVIDSVTDIAALQPTLDALQESAALELQELLATIAGK